MKKLFLISVLCLSLLSCKKIYQCECRQVVNGEDWNPLITNVPVEARTKSDAKALCNSFDYSFGWQDYKTCNLK
jgi:hypothetical protein